MHRTGDLPIARSTNVVTTTAGDVTEDVSDIIENLERDSMGASGPDSWRTALEAELTTGGPIFAK